MASKLVKIKGEKQFFEVIVGVRSICAFEATS